MAAVSEKRLVWKLDALILLYCSLAYFTNYLDRAAFANAYVSGLRESLHLSGNDYSTLLSLFTAGTCVAQVPHALLVPRIPPRIYLPLNLLAWSALTMACGAANSYATLAPLRFFQGAFESCLYSGTIYILGCWYRPEEMAKRTALFTGVGQVGAMCAGAVMSGMADLGGQGGLEGWRWVFLVNGLIGVPVGVWGLLFFPDLPRDGRRVRWLSEKEVQLARERVPPREKGVQDGVWAVAKRTLASPTIYVLTAYSALASALEAVVIQGLFLLYLRGLSGLPAHAPTLYPLGVQGVAIVSNVTAGYVIDVTSSRLPMVLVAGVLQLTVASLLLAPVPQGAKFAAFYLAGTSYIVNPIVYGWASVICQRGDDSVRSVVLYAMSLVQSVLYTFWGVVLYPATDAPHWTKGCITLIAVVFAFFAATGAVSWLDRRTKDEDSPR